MFTVVFSGLKEKLAHGQNLINKHLDWVEESGDLRPGWTEVKQKSDIVDSEETPASYFPRARLDVQLLLNNVSLNEGPTQSPFSPPT